MRTAHGYISALVINGQTLKAHGKYIWCHCDLLQSCLACKHVSHNKIYFKGIFDQEQVLRLVTWRHVSSKTHSRVSMKDMSREESVQDTSEIFYRVYIVADIKTSWVCVFLYQEMTLVKTCSKYVLIGRFVLACVFGTLFYIIKDVFILETLMHGFDF